MVINKKWKRKIKQFVRLPIPKRIKHIILNIPAIARIINYIAFLICKLKIVSRNREIYANVNEWRARKGCNIFVSHMKFWNGCLWCRRYPRLTLYFAPDFKLIGRIIESKQPWISLLFLFQKCVTTTWSFFFFSLLFQSGMIDIFSFFPLRNVFYVAWLYSRQLSI